MQGKKSFKITSINDFGSTYRYAKTHAKMHAGERNLSNPHRTQQSVYTEVQFVHSLYCVNICINLKLLRERINKITSYIDE